MSVLTGSIYSASESVSSNTEPESFGILCSRKFQELKIFLDSPTSGSGKKASCVRVAKKIASYTLNNPFKSLVMVASCVVLGMIPLTSTLVTVGVVATLVLATKVINKKYHLLDKFLQTNFGARLEAIKDNFQDDISEMQRNHSKDLRNWKFLILATLAGGAYISSGLIVPICLTAYGVSAAMNSYAARVEEEAQTHTDSLILEAIDESDVGNY